MKTSFAIFVLLVFGLMTAHSQRVQWVSPNLLPLSASNASTSVTAAGTTDGAGSSAWLLTATTTTFLPGPVPIFTSVVTQHLVWLNKSGAPIFNGEIAVEDGTNLTATLVRMTRTDVILQIRGTMNLTNSFGILRRYSAGRGGVTITNTPLVPNETVAPFFILFPASTVPLPDKTGFFTVALGAPPVGEFVVRRYSNK